MFQVPRRIAKSFINVQSFAQSQNQYYYPDNIDLKSKESFFKASETIVTKSKNLLPHPPADANIMKFGAFHTDHLLQIDWTEQNGWGKPQIGEFKNFQIHPFSSCLHYAIECFEGSKAYKNEKGQLRWFRPECNMFRMKNTAHRIGLPDFDGQEFMDAIVQLLKLDESWIPAVNGFSAYLRPTFIATEETLGVRYPTKAKLFCAICPVGPYFPGALKPIKVYCNTQDIRSAPGGIGQYKVGGNYGPTILPNRNVEKMGYNQSLWMLASGLIQEMGVCNLFFFWKNKDGEDELITPMLDGTILPGVVRDSVLRITRQINRFKVTERQIYIPELIEALEQKRVHDIFGVGTAVNIQPIRLLGYKGKDYTVDVDENLGAGKLAYELSQLFQSIQTGDQPHPWIKQI